MAEWLLGASAVAAVGLALWLWRQQSSHRDNNGAYSADFGGDYFRGLNYLLNEQPDKALEVFLQLAEVNPDTVETHLALGNLFRRRGEVEHAIRCHENIIAKDSISAAERNHALLELAEDYRRAGLLDRAEDLYHQLAEHPEGRDVALHRLLEIYQQEQDWTQATKIAGQLLALGDQRMNPLIAHFHCERASQALADGDWQSARQALAEARSHHPESLRRRLLDAQCLLREGHPRDAMEALRRALREHPDLLPVALNTLAEACRAAHADAELRQELHDWLNQRHDVSATVTLAELYQANGDHSQATDLLLTKLQQRPNVRLLRQLLHQLNGTEYNQLSTQLRPVVERLCQDLLSNEVAFRCRQCGYGGHTHHWQCPSCKQWDSTWPVRGVTGE